MFGHPFLARFFLRRRLQEANIVRLSPFSPPPFPATISPPLYNKGHKKKNLLPPKKGGKESYLPPFSLPCFLAFAAAAAEEKVSREKEGILLLLFPEMGLLLLLLRRSVGGSEGAIG